MKPSAAFIVGAIVLLSAVVRFGVARTFDVPWIAPDEMIYGLVGQSLWESGTLTIRGGAVPYYSLLTPALIGLPLAVSDLARGVAIAQALQALAMSLVAVPVYLWGKPIVGTRWALAAAALAVLPPALWYGGLLMTEALFYPLVVAALLALARMLEEPTLFRQGTFLLILSFAAAVRLQALLLLLVLLVATGLFAWFGRSLAILHRLVPLLALVGVSAVALGVLYATGENDLFGAYGTVADEAPSSTGAIAQIVWHTAALYLMVLGLPLLATATLAVDAARKGETDLPVRAFLAVATAYVVLLVVQVSTFAAGHLDHVSRRYLITALPPLLLGLCVWISRGAPRPRLIATLVVASSIAALVTLPAGRFVTVISADDVMAVVPFGELAQRGDTAFRLGLLAFGLVLGIIFLALPDRFLPWSAAAVAIGLVALSAFGAREIDRLSAVERTRAVTGDLDWIDRSRASDVLVVDTGEHSSTSIARTIFWNDSVRRAVRIDGVPAQALPQPVVTIGRDGTVVDGRGTEVSGPHVVVPTTLVPRGEQLVSTPPTELAPGYALWRVDEPLRFVSRRAGFSPVGDFRSATVVVYDCGPGALDLLLLGKDGLPVRITVNGLPWLTVQPQPGGRWTGSIPSLRSGTGNDPCLFQLESDGLVGSTRVEWVHARSR